MCVSVFVSRFDVHTYVPYALCVCMFNFTDSLGKGSVLKACVFDEYDRLSAVVGVPIEMDASVRPVLSSPS